MKILKLIRDTTEEKRASPESRRGDLLDRLIDVMKSDNLLTENLISYVIFVLLFATSGRSPQLQVWPSSYWQSMLLLCKFSAKTPVDGYCYQKENEEIISSREDKETGLTWKEYKSMTFTMHVINEALRISGGVGILRRTKQDIQVNDSIFTGYTFPKDWSVFLFSSAVFMNPDIYKEHLAFNPWRWKLFYFILFYFLNGMQVPLEFRLPEEVWRGKEVQLSHLKVFGCVSYVHIDSDARNKLEAKSKKCFFIGYGDEEFGFRFWDDQNRKIIRSRNVIFNEKVMYKDRSSGETEMADSDTSPPRSEFIRLEGLPDVTKENNNQESLQEDSNTSVPTSTQEDAEQLEPAVRRWW
ncbi:hypothetical protein POTOM_009762 [Populus tomentosa]|uniref:Retroviral polymerase SH3-like domain-containing protein n=1 Tax=Populus tomentosa TaxID=118781 RepID=A0A8X8A6V9_POPTO|nr:hypothetical protein POTOM_009762 [Populus tomentosa]